MCTQEEEDEKGLQCPVAKSHNVFIIFMTGAEAQREVPKRIHSERIFSSKKGLKL
jgi:hypothetical protein